MLLMAPGLSYAVGNFGEPCIQPGRECAQGVCVNAGPFELCTQCGGPGERCCDPRSVPPRCYYGNEGYRCIRGYCQKRGPADFEAYCGQRGTPPCRGKSRTPCFHGTTYDASAGVCVACGDLGQPCCVWTDYPCDYGSCTAPYPFEGGLCVDQATLSGATSHAQPVVPTPRRPELLPTDPSHLDQLNFDRYLESQQQPPAPRANCRRVCVEQKIEWHNVSDGRHGLCAGGVPRPPGPGLAPPKCEKAVSCVREEVRCD